MEIYGMDLKSKRNHFKSVFKRIVLYCISTDVKDTMYLKRFVASKYHMCSVGAHQWNVGTRKGDSGAAIFRKEHGRFILIINPIVYIKLIIFAC